MIDVDTREDIETHSQDDMLSIRSYGKRLGGILFSGPRGLNDSSRADVAQIISVFFEITDIT
jgi:hypothetical protein